MLLNPAKHFCSFDFFVHSSNKIQFGLVFELYFSFELTLNTKIQSQT